MKVIQVSFDEATLSQLDACLVSPGARSAFIRDAVARELKRRATEEKDRQYRLGYERFPIEPGEFDLQADDDRWPEW